MNFFIGIRKIFTIAVREYKAMVATKAFALSIIMMPLIMLGSIFVMEFLRDRAEIKTRNIAVIDHTDLFIDAIETAAKERNDQIDRDLQQDKAATQPAALGFVTEKYAIEKIETVAVDSQTLLDLSDRIRSQELYAILEIPAELRDAVLADAPWDLRDGEFSDDATMRFYSQESSLADSKLWLAGIVNEIVKQERLASLDIDSAEVKFSSTPVPLAGMGLVSLTDGGEITSEQQANPFSVIFVPLGVMLLMFVVIFMSAQPMLESVLEEKSQRIAEVLLGSVNSFQLMAGKLLGTVAGSLTVFAIYLVSMLAFAFYKDYVDQIPFHLAPWFVLFQILGVLFYASIFLAIGASVSQLKEAQAMLLPVWLMMMSPIFVWLLLVRDPLGNTATMFSLFPPAAPTAMMLRLATGQAIPLWQPIAGALLTALSTLAIVFFAARIFRVGILWQGKTPRVGEILRWAFRG
jgi:ABC-type Na+ efflux pump permease subunit